MKKTRSVKKRGARLGQHFLTNAHYARVLAEAVGTREGETIIEIGPGTGALTRELLKTGKRVVAIEKDGELAAQLRATFATAIQDGQITIVTGDARDFDPSAYTPYVLAANIPYYITGELIRMFLTAKKQPRAMALLIQKEVAQRVIARGKKESILSISVKAYGDPRIVANVSRGNFNPPPSVDSAILLIENISRNFFTDTDEKWFFNVVRAGFSSKRKKLAGNLRQAFGTTPPLSDIRAEDMPLHEWKRVAKEIIGNSPSL